MAGKAKVLGTLIGIGGAMLLTFYKGVQINTGSIHLDLIHHQHHGASSSSSYSSHPSSAHHLWGALLALGSCISYALWLNVQVFLVSFHCKWIKLRVCSSLKFSLYILI